MFTGKSVCLGAVGVITGICLLSVFDSKVSTSNKLKLIGLTGLLGVIVTSL